MKVASFKSKLTALANKFDRDFNALALEFAIERLVIRLQENSLLSKHLIFKGGFVLLKVYGSNRATVDLDASIHEISIEEAEKLAISQITRDWQDGLWMGAIETETLEHQTKYAGKRLIIRFSFEKPKVHVKRLGKLILDIGIADKITPGVIQAEILPLMGGEPISWKIYPIETIVAEKIHALVVHGNQNSRIKDVYDLTILLPKCSDKTLLSRAIDQTFDHRSTEQPLSFVDFWRNLDKTILKRSSGAIYAATGSIPKFDDLNESLAGLLRVLE